MQKRVLLSSLFCFSVLPVNVFSAGIPVLMEKFYSESMAYEYYDGLGALCVGAGGEFFGYVNAVPNLGEMEYWVYASCDRCNSTELQNDREADETPCREACFSTTIYCVNNGWTSWNEGIKYPECTQIGLPITSGVCAESSFKVYS